MVKCIILLRRKAGDDRDAFRRWWLEEHRPLAQTLPGLRRCVFNLLPDGSPWDAIVEQGFDSETAALAAYQSEIGAAVAADSLAHVSERVRMLVEDHEVVPSPLT